MNDLLFSCADSLPQPDAECATDYGRAIRVILSRSPVRSVGDVPTALEFANAYNGGQIVNLSGFTNFTRSKVGETQIDDPETGASRSYDGKYLLSGRIKRIDNMIQRLTEILTRYEVLYAYYITDRDWCFGGYKTEPFFSMILKNATPIYMDFRLYFYDIGIDSKLQDEDYELVPGLTSYLITEDDRKILTEDGKYITF
jgi:hypothetical protein